jgi:F-type H+-transporting ATPase subunit delta
VILDRAIAKRYATSLLEVVAPDDLLSKVKGELSSVLERLRESDSYKKHIFSRFSPERVKRALVETLIEGMQLSAIVINFINLLILNNRLELLEIIIFYFNELILKKTNIIKVELVTSGNDLDLELELKKVFNSISSKSIFIDTTIDPDILDGFIVKVDNKVLDYSLRNKLKRLERSLKQ